MFDSWNQSRRASAAKVLVALVSVTGCFAAVAYAAVAPSAPRAGGAHPRPAGMGVNASLLRPALDPRLAGSRPPRPRITRHPAKTTVSTSVAFRYVDRLPQLAFQCRLDGGAWKTCGPRVVYRGLAVGAHRFLVRAEGPSGVRSLPARFSWVQAQPKRLTIKPELSGLGQLYPGAPPQALPLVVGNPNSSPISVTSLRVAVAADPVGCDSAANLELIQSSASSAKPLQIPAGGSVRLPAKGVSAPAIALRDLPVNQDACRGAQFPLSFSGEARG